MGIGSFFTGIGSAISTGVKTLCAGIRNFVSGVAAKVGPVIAKAANGICEFAGKIATGVKAFCEVIGNIGKLINGAAQAMNIVEADDSAGAIGMRAAKSDLKPENFKTTKEYIEAIKKDVEFDNEEFEKKTAEEKAQYTILGGAIEGKAISEESKVYIPGEFWAAMGHIFTNGIKLQPEQLAKFILSMNEKGYDDMSPVVAYFERSGDINRPKVGSDIKDSLSSSGIDARFEDVMEASSKPVEDNDN